MGMVLSFMKYFPATPQSDGKHIGAVSGLAALVAGYGIIRINEVVLDWSSPHLESKSHCSRTRAWSLKVNLCFEYVRRSSKWPRTIFNLKVPVWGIFTCFFFFKRSLSKWCDVSNHQTTTDQRRQNYIRWRLTLEKQFLLSSGPTRSSVTLIFSTLSGLLFFLIHITIHFF